MNQQQKQGQVGNVQVLNSMRAAVQQRRAAGQVTVPIQWVDSWISQLQTDYGSFDGYGFPYDPYRPYWPYHTFHPIDTFVPLFSSNARVTFTSTLK
jgi:hypothetical protein